jgi:phage repressor protein C with HTH and peptisase S24 domain
LNASCGRINLCRPAEVSLKFVFHGTPTVIGDFRFRQVDVGKFPFACRDWKSDISAMGAATVRRKVEPDLRLRITRRLSELNLSPIDAATKAGLERNFIRDLVKDKKISVSQRSLPKVARALGWTVAQLLGEDAPDTTSIGHDLMVVPEIDLRVGVSYGVGRSAEDLGDESEGRSGGAIVRSKWSFPSPFLRDELHLRAGRVQILPIRGDSMADALFDGDRAIIDLDDTDVSQGGIFALQDDGGQVIVRQVEFVRGSGRRRIECTARNPHYKPFELVLEDPVRIIGRVASKITRL